MRAEITRSNVGFVPADVQELILSRSPVALLASVLTIGPVSCTHTAPVSQYKGKAKQSWRHPRQGQTLNASICILSSNQFSRASMSR
jgi:hypothetical protein